MLTDRLRKLGCLILLAQPFFYCIFPSETAAIVSPISLVVAKKTRHTPLFNGFSFRCQDIIAEKNVLHTLSHDGFLSINNRLYIIMPMYSVLSHDGFLSINNVYSWWKCALISRHSLPIKVVYGWEMGICFIFRRRLLDAIRYMPYNNCLAFSVLYIREIGLKCLYLLIAEEGLQLVLPVEIVTSCWRRGGIKRSHKWAIGICLRRMHLRLGNKDAHRICLRTYQIGFAGLHSCIC